MIHHPSRDSDALCAPENAGLKGLGRTVCIWYLSQPGVAFFASGVPLFLAHWLLEYLFANLKRPFEFLRTECVQTCRLS